MYEENIYACMLLSSIHIKIREQKSKIDLVLSINWLHKALAALEDKLIIKKNRKC